MSNVIIVDDEPVIRFGLKASVNWDEEGLHLLGDYPNGEEALKVIEENHIDILITDIKMPIMDGITLMKKALERLPNLKVIIVSSYNDFQYVQEGLRHGAMDYVLKPTLEPEEFLQLIRKCVKKINEEKDIHTKLSLFDQTEDALNRKNLEQKLKKVILHGTEDLELIDSWMSGSFTVIYAKVIDVEEAEEDFGGLYKNFVLEEIQERFYKGYAEGVCLIIGETEILFLLKSVEDIEKEIGRLEKHVMKEVNLNISFSYTFISQLNEITKGYQLCLTAFKKRFFHPEQNIFKYESDNERSFKRLDAKQLKQFLIPYDQKKVKEFIKARYEQWKQEMMEPAHIQQEATDILSNLFYNKLEPSLVLDKCTDLKKTETLERLYSSLLVHIADCEQLIVNQNNKPYVDNDLMDQAMEYIHQKYTQALTLQMVADHIHISRNYFSILFKRFSDVNFIDYVIDLRIKKAEELLARTSLKVYEVARESGFNDVKYFSKLFKKVTGYTPVDYRTEYQK
ncbi:response regulator [Radiobacillus sp. PE A8.2]|uniref:response regulator transcription factor n=1 Tax=Radiobacillus sp. PE A8.2 TaxID=3380349 RepID=UPI00388D938C